MRDYLLQLRGTLRLRAVAAVCASVVLAGCAMGPLPSSTSHEAIATGSIGTAAPSTGLGEIHSGTCSGLALERIERLRRIDVLQESVNAELTKPPATIEQAMQRSGSSPEQGTTAYRDLAAERVHLDTVKAAEAKMSCPIDVATKAQ